MAAKNLVAKKTPNRRTGKTAGTRESARASAGTTAREPRSRRLELPADYGKVPKAGAGLLPWSHVQARLAAAQRYWLCTVNRAGKPHCTPVDGLWIDDCLFFGGSAQTRWQRNLAANAAACVHLEEPLDVVTVYGVVASRRGVDRPLAVRLHEMSKKKYGFSFGADGYQKAPILMLRPTLAVAWKDFPKDPTRFEFAQPGAAPPGTWKG